MKNRRTVVATACAAVLCLVFAVGAAKLDPAFGRGLSAIKWSVVYDYNKTLASDRFGGRLDADAAYMDMTKWVSAHYKEWGLKPVSAKDGYLQFYPLPYTVIDSAEMTLFVPEKKEEPKGFGKMPPDGPPPDRAPKPAAPPVLKEMKLEPVTDFLPHTSAASGEAVQAGLVFAGYGLSAPELGYDDLAGIDVKGKFVLCFSGGPEPADKFEKARENGMKVLKEKGALGVIKIMDPLGHPNSGNWIEGFMPGMISEKVADQILAEKGVTVDKLRQDLRLYNRPLTLELSTKVSYKVVSRHFPDAKACNVIGYIEGSDPKLKDEVVLFGAHADHIGRHMGMLFPGANDNASGSAVVMQIAQAFSQMGRRPKRTVAFVLFSGEEFGLVGSQFLARNLPPQFKKIAAMINFDMVGEGDGAMASCSPEPPELKQAIETAAKYVDVIKGPVRVHQATKLGGTDQTAFAVVLNCPNAGFFSNGPHLAYHKPGDTIYRINPDILADIAKAAYLSGAIFADR